MGPQSWDMQRDSETFRGAANEPPGAPSPAQPREPDEADRPESRAEGAPPGRGLGDNS